MMPSGNLRPDLVREHRAALWEAGYRPLPVFSSQKRPYGRAWQDEARRDPPPCVSALSHPGSANTGVLCDGLRVLDIDIEDTAIAGQVEREARELLGAAPVRYRAGTGKRALFYRAEQGEPGKRTISGAAGKIEALGRGQQLVVAGIHPAGMPYEWIDADGAVIDGLQAAPRESLVAIGEDDLVAFLEVVAPIIGADEKAEHQPIEPAGGMPVHAPDHTGERICAAAAKALEEDCAKLANMGRDTGRNNALNGTAYRLGRFVAAGGLSRSEAETALEQACSANEGWAEDGPKACRATIRSGLDSGIAAGPVTLGEREKAVNGGPVLDPSPLLAGHVGQAASVARGEVHWHGDADAILTRRELVKGLLPSGDVVLIAGQAGAGKTFVAIDLAASVALQLDFFGHRIRDAGGSFFILGEGGGTISERLEAVRTGKLADAKSARGLPIAWHVLNGSLSHAETFEAVLKLARETASSMQARHGIPLRLIVVDTLAAAFTMQDENDAAAATAAMKALQRLHAETGALVAAVAHFGKTAETGVRGSSAFTASADAILAVHAERDPMTGKVNARSLALTKSRWRDTGWQQAFDLESALIGQDEDGEDVWSCWVQPGGAVVERQAHGGRASKGTAFLLQALSAAIADDGQRKFPHGAEGEEVVAVPKEALRLAFFSRYPADGDTEAKRTSAKGKAFHRALQAAQLSGAIGFKDEGREAWIWKA